MKNSNVQPEKCDRGFKAVILQMKERNPFRKVFDVDDLANCLVLVNWYMP